MRVRLYLINIALLAILVRVNAQVKPADVPGKLQDLFYWILNSSSDSERERLNDSVIILIDSYVRSDSVMRHRFSNVRNLGQIDSPDKKVKIVNWNLVLRNGNNRYYLYIIRSGKKNGPNIVYRLTGPGSTNTISPDLIYTSDNWYGAAYYAIQPFKEGKNVSYLLLGINFGNNFVTRKIIDVLNFNDSGGITFGKPCFHKDSTTMAREILEYSSDGLISLRLQSDKLVVFDHLDTYASGHGSNPDAKGAGLFFDGYALKKGSWNFVSNIEVRNRK